MSIYSCWMADDRLTTEAPVAAAPSHEVVSRTGRDVRLGVVHSLPALIGVLPVGLAFGLVVTQSGLTWWWATAFATVVFAGSLEFVLVALVGAAAPLGQVAVTALLVNFRHVFYALSFPLHRVHGRWARAYSTFALTDEAWALTTSPEAQTWSRARILAIQATFQVGWVGGVTLGALAGGLIPDAVVGLQFAVTAFFIVLTIDAYKATGRLSPLLLGVGCALVAGAAFGADLLVPALTGFIAIVVCAHVVRGRRAA